MTGYESCNRELNDRMMDHIDHALGRPVMPLKESSRNYFAVDTGSDLAAEFSASPWWQMLGRQGCMSFFGVTEAGRHALAEHLRKISDRWRVFELTFGEHSRLMSERSAAKARYAWWLDISDLLPDLTFFDFCRKTRVRAVGGVKLSSRDEPTLANPANG